MGVVIGLPVMLFGTIPNITFNIVDIIVMLLAALMLFVFSYNDNKIKRKEGIVFLLMFVAYYSYVIFG